MKYRKFGKLSWKVSALGFGAMRLPLASEDRSNINETEAINMIRYAFDHGVNYIDTAYPYHGGKSEVVVGKALKDGYREKVRLATKMPTWLVNSKVDMDKFFGEQLNRLQTDYVDFYLLHGLGKERWIKMRDLNVLDWAEEQIVEGKIRHLGFSFHDNYEAFKEIIDSYNKWTLSQIQYNYMDADLQAGTKGLRYAASKGLAVVVMEPISGGMLAVNPPREVQAIWDESEVKRMPSEWALQWVWNQHEVSVALSGMSTMQQVVENVESASHSGQGLLTKKELELFARVQKKYLEYGFIGCTGCRYCMPCEQGVNIPEIFKILNEYHTKRGNQESQNQIVKKYLEIIPSEKGAKRCIKDGRCEELCPQKLPIRRLLDNAAWIFEKDRT